MHITESQRKAVGYAGTVGAVGASQLGPTVGISLVCVAAGIMAWAFWPNEVKRQGLWTIVERAMLPCVLVIAVLAALPEMPGHWDTSLRIALSRVLTVVFVLCLVIVALYCIGKMTAAPSILAPAPPAPALSLTSVSSEDQDSIHKLRVVWNQRNGGRAVAGLAYLFGSAVGELESRLYWIELLKPIGKALEDKAEALDTALDTKNTTTTLQEVIARFNTLYGGYAVAARWLYRLAKREDALRTPEYLARTHAVWQEAEKEFRREIEALSEWDSFKGKLHIAFQVPSEASLFLGVHKETPPLPPSGPSA